MGEEKEMKIQRSEPRFNCSCCGFCCRCIAKVLPKFDRGDGACKYLDEETNLCTIYEDRPLVCRVDDAYDVLGEEKLGMSRLEWYEKNHACCRDIQELFKKKGNENV